MQNTQIVTDDEEEQLLLEKQTEFCKFLDRDEKITLYKTCMHGPDENCEDVVKIFPDSSTSAKIPEKRNLHFILSFPFVAIFMYLLHGLLNIYLRDPFLKYIGIMG